MRLIPSFAAAAFVFACLAPAFAQPVTDTASGLSATPPPGYTAELSQPRPRYVADISVRRAEDRPGMGCRVGFQSAPQNNSLTQAQINEQSAKPEWRNLIRATMELIYNVTSIDSFEHDGIKGAVVIALIKPRDGLPPEAADIRNFLVMLETPKGRTNIVCVALKDSFETRRSEFEQVVRGATAPR